jgi:hypothetical protein
MGWFWAGLDDATDLLVMATGLVMAEAVVSEFV